MINKTLGYIKLVYCALVVIWHSSAIITLSSRNKLSRAKTNYHLRKGAQRILKSVKADYKIQFKSDHQFEKGTPYIFMSNHISLMDLPLIFAAMPGSIRLIAKKELFQIPIFGKALSKIEFLQADRERPEQMQEIFDDAKKHLQNNLWLWIFPEGTRSGNGELLPLKIGGIRLAREVNAKIIPVAIIGTNHLLPARTLRLNSPQKLILNIGEAIDTNQFQGMEGQKELLQCVRFKIEELKNNNIKHCHCEERSDVAI